MIGISLSKMMASGAFPDMGILERRDDVGTIDNGLKMNVFQFMAQGLLQEFDLCGVVIDDQNGEVCIRHGNLPEERTKPVIVALRNSRPTSI